MCANIPQQKSHVAAFEGASPATASVLRLPVCWLWAIILSGTNPSLSFVYSCCFIVVCAEIKPHCSLASCAQWASVDVSGPRCATPCCEPATVYTSQAARLFSSTKCHSANTKQRTLEMLHEFTSRYLNQGPRMHPTALCEVKLPSGMQSLLLIHR